MIGVCCHTTEMEESRREDFAQLRSDVTASLSTVEALHPQGLGDAAQQLGDRITRLDDVMTCEHRRLAELRAAWHGVAAESAFTRADHDLAGQRLLRDKLGALASALAAGGFQLASIRAAVLDIVTGLRSRGWQVTDAGIAVAPPSPTILRTFEAAFTAAIQRLLAIFPQVDQSTAAVVNTVAAASGAPTSSGGEAVSYAFGPGGGPPLSPQHGSPEPESNRRENQIDAFKAATGRDPVTENDWRTAAMLDPHNYFHKNAGVQSNVVVGRINPVDGQGVVQTNLFIPGEEAWYPDLTGGISGHNLGDNRGFNPSAGPEDSRVVLFVDYDNGLVIARQNPSVDTGGGGVKVGTPQINVSQNPNGSVKIDYRAVDPFSPGGEDVALASPWAVNGELVIKPTADGPVAGGIVSSFPAIEIYNHEADGTSEIAKIMPQNVSQFGPLAGLPFSQDIGMPLMGEFPDTMILPPAGVPNVSSPLEPGELPPVARPTPPIVIRYPSVDLGPVEDNMNVPVGS